MSFVPPLGSLPPYTKLPDQAIYNEEFNQTLLDWFSPNGFTIPQLTDAQLRTNNFIAPDGSVTTVAAYMPNSFFVFVTDAVPPCYVGKISNALVKFTTTPYP